MQQTARYRYSRMMPYILGEWRGLGLIFLLTLASAGIAVLLPWPLKILVDYAFGDLAMPEALQKSLNKLKAENAELQRKVQELEEKLAQQEPADGPDEEAEAA